MRFFRTLLDDGVDLRLFGRGLPMHLRPGGQLMDKGSVLRLARFTLAIENYADGDLYVTEKNMGPAPVLVPAAVLRFDRGR